MTPAIPLRSLNKDLHISDSADRADRYRRDPHMAVAGRKPTTLSDWRDAKQKKINKQQQKMIIVVMDRHSDRWWVVSDTCRTAGTCERRWSRNAGMDAGAQEIWPKDTCVHASPGLLGVCGDSQYEVYASLNSRAKSLLHQCYLHGLLPVFPHLSSHQPQSITPFTLGWKHSCRARLI